MEKQINYYTNKIIDELIVNSTCPTNSLNKKKTELEDIYLNKKFNYSVLIPPLSKEIKDLNEDEANEFFKWYQTESKIQGWRIQKIYI